jgi:hypothetical protein
MDEEAYLDAARASRYYAARMRSPVMARSAPTQQIDGRKAGRLAAKRQVRAICRLCTDAGKPELAAEYLLASKTVDEVQAALAAQSAPAAASTAHDLAILLALAQIDVDKTWERAFAQARAGRRPG